MLSNDFRINIFNLNFSAVPHFYLSLLKIGMYFWSDANFLFDQYLNLFFAALISILQRQFFFRRANFFFVELFLFCRAKFLFRSAKFFIIWRLNRKRFLSIKAYGFTSVHEISRENHVGRDEKFTWFHVNFVWFHVSSREILSFLNFPSTVIPLYKIIYE